MYVIYPTNTNQHHPPYEIFNGEQTSHNETPNRMEKILNALRKTDHTIEVPKLCVPDSLLEKIHSPKYLDFLRKSAQEGNCRCDYQYPSVFPYRTGHLSKNILAQQGYFSFDLYTPISDSTYSAALDSASAAYEAAILVQSQKHRYVYALCRPPGHHAEKDQMGGYCYLNNCAIAAKYLSDFGKVATIDIDFHHGNGTQHLFYDRADIFTTSIHADPNWKFPFYSGYENEVGLGNGEGYNLNRTLTEGTDNRNYHKVLIEVMQKIADFAPKYMVVSFGTDIHESDPIGGFTLTTRYLQTIGQTIANLNLPTVIVQEGGYNTELLGENVVSFLKGFAI